MEREGRGKHFANRKRLIVARSAAVISVVAAGVTALEKSVPTNPVTDALDSASHLVLTSPHIAYGQFIDKLPKVENAEAGAVQKTCYKSAWAMTPNYNCSGTNMPVVVGNHISIYYEDFAFFDHICHSNVTAAGEFEITANVLVDPANDDCDQFGTPPVNNVTIDVCNFSPNQVEARPQQAVVALAVCSASVGGVADDPDLSQLGKNIDTRDKNNTLPVAAGAVAAIGAIGATGVALYINRRRSS